MATLISTAVNGTLTITDNVGIGTTNPIQKLDVIGIIRGTSSNPYVIRAKTSSGSNSFISFEDPINGSNDQVYCGSEGNNFIIGTNYSEKVRVNSSGSVGIGTTGPAYKLDVSGTIRATGDVIAYSDARVKENVQTIENAIDKVLNMRGVFYNKIEETDRKVGVIAQEMLEVLPEVVSKDETGMYSVAYGNITAVLIEAIKAQQLQIEELRSKLK